MLPGDQRSLASRRLSDNQSDSDGCSVTSRQDEEYETSGNVQSSLLVGMIFLALHFITDYGLRCCYW